jgi:hypothetical protein
MWSHRRSRRPSDLEATLRESRAEPREEFVQNLADHVSAERPVRTAWSRLAFAGAASTMILGMFASFGGLGYAASGANSTYSVVKKAVVQHKLSVDVHKSSAAAQYPDNTPSQEPPANNVAGETTGSAAGAVAGAQTLPFTGVSRLVTVLIGLALLTTGLILRRRERSDS